jgi:hypothetical protein
VRAALLYLAAANHQDLVGLPDGGQAVRDDQRRPAGQRGLECPLDSRLGFGVQMRAASHASISSFSVADGLAAWSSSTTKG